VSLSLTSAKHPQTSASLLLTSAKHLYMQFIHFKNRIV
jgi:hypothetical protein